MSAGDILDQAIRIYRENFVALVTIVAIVTVPLLVIQAVVVGLSLPFAGDFTTPPDIDSPTLIIAVVIVTILVSLVAAILGIIQLGALTSFVSERFLGRPITVRQAYGNAFRRWLGLLIAALLLGLAFLGLFLLFFGIIFIPAIAAALTGAESDTASAMAGVGFLCLCVLVIPALIAMLYLYTRWTFWTQAIMLESYNSTGGLGRSWKLVKGSFWRVLGFNLLLGILVYALSFGVVGAISVTLIFLPSPVLRFIVQTVFNGLLGVIIAPLQYATLTVLYYDLRIRKEGFDLQVQMQEP